jgi:Xaa-Pro dipeptidase
VQLDEIRDQLRAEGLDGWLFYDHHHRDPIAYRVLGLPADLHASRRWYYFVPAEGEPGKLVHRIEARALDDLPGDKLVYSAWQEQQARLGELLGDANRVAMQFSPDCMNPYVSLVDGGTIDRVRSLGVEVATSASLVQFFEARWSEAQRVSHVEAGKRIDPIRRAAFEEIAKRLRTGDEVQEFAIAEFVRDRFREQGLHAEDGPIVAVNAHAGDPHYAPTAESSWPIRKGDVVLIDMWGKLADVPGSVYYDITWTGHTSDAPPDEVSNVFDIVTRARDAALELARSRMDKGLPLAGYEVDDACRSVIAGAGYGEAFVHRTGHSIGEEVHGNGANADNLEVRDERPIIPRTCFSIEPGIYLPEFGIRSEIDCYVSESTAEATGEVQRELLRIVSPS